MSRPTPPTYKARNWPAYNEALKRRGSLSIWFHDDYTDVPYRRRNWAPDGPRNKPLGNSMAVNVMGWLGERIAPVQ